MYEPGKYKSKSMINSGMVAKAVNGFGMGMLIGGTVGAMGGLSK
tara:strand:+ start:549 stop:680 length:132 start_codon:yes stop_codon:yes gene_type:complete